MLSCGGKPETPDEFFDGFTNLRSTTDKNSNQLNETKDVDIPLRKYGFTKLVSCLKALLKKRDKNFFEINIKYVLTLRLVPKKLFLAGVT